MAAFPWVEKLAELAADCAPDGWESVPNSGRTGKDNHGDVTFWAYHRYDGETNLDLEVYLVAFTYSQSEELPRCADNPDEAKVMINVCARFREEITDSTPLRVADHTFLAERIEPEFFPELTQILQHAYIVVETLNP